MTPPVLAIVGPTASGKSAVAMAVAERRRTAGAAPVEIVAVDAFTVYRGMDVGTAKPSGQDRAAVPHHLVDVLEPTEEVTVAWFQAAARAAVADVRARGGVPLLVGGSGLYFRAVVDDLRFPPTDPAVRAAIEDRWSDAAEAAWHELDRIDPVAAARIDPANLRRTVRALEVIELTGERFSSYAGVWERFESVYQELQVGYLEPPDDVLRARISERAVRMVEDGLLDEAARLRRLEAPPSRTARQAIGYREAFAMLDGELPREELPTAIADRTWAYARRQRSWFRRDPRCVPASADEVLERFS